MKKIFAYKNNWQFLYLSFDGSIVWYTEQGKYIGTTDNSVFTVHKFLDNYINEMRG